MFFYFSKRRKTYFNLCHESVKFTSQKQTNNKLSILDIEISRDRNQLIVSVYRKPTFSGVFPHFDVSFRNVAKSSYDQLPFTTAIKQGQLYKKLPVTCFLLPI